MPPLNSKNFEILNTIHIVYEKLLGQEGIYTAAAAAALAAKPARGDRTLQFKEAIPQKPAARMKKSGSQFIGQFLIHDSLSPLALNSHAGVTSSYR